MLHTTFAANRCKTVGGYPQWQLLVLRLIRATVNCKFILDRKPVTNALPPQFKIKIKFCNEIREFKTGSIFYKKVITSCSMKHNLATIHGPLKELVVFLSSVVNVIMHVQQRISQILALRCTCPPLVDTSALDTSKDVSPSSLNLCRWSYVRIYRVRWDR